MTQNVLCALCAALTVALLTLSGCAAPHGDATLGSHGDGLQLGGNLGVQIGGANVSGGTGGGCGGPGR